MLMPLAMAAMPLTTDMKPVYDAFRRESTMGIGDCSVAAGGESAACRVRNQAAIKVLNAD
jgi:hypothetical protein